VVRGGRVVGGDYGGLAGSKGRGGRDTVGGVLLDDLHDADDGGDFAAGVVEEAEVAFLHGSKVVPCWEGGLACVLLASELGFVLYLDMPGCLVRVSVGF
jgi:hypothetical protein